MRIDDVIDALTELRKRSPYSMVDTIEEVPCLSCIRVLTLSEQVFDYDYFTRVLEYRGTAKEIYG